MQYVTSPVKTRIVQRKLQINKNYVPSYSPGYGEFEMFVSVDKTVSVSRVFVYNLLDVNKIVTVSLTIPSPYINVQLVHLIGQSLVNILSQIPSP